MNTPLVSPIIAVKPSAYAEISIEAPVERAELICDFITQECSAGLALTEDEGAATVVARFYVLPEEVEPFRMSFADFHQRVFGVAPPEISVRNVASVDWEENYRRSVLPTLVGNRIYVRPTWSPPPSEEGMIDIIIDPKMAFGTGAHETTRLCLVALEREELVGKCVADIGCGSAILAILAAKRGARKVFALDTDPIAVENSVENCQLNGVSDIVEVGLGSLDIATTGAQFDVLVANIIRETIIELFPQLMAATRSGGAILLSGLLERDGAEIEALLRQNGVDSWRRDQMGEWLLFRFLRP